MDLRGYLGARDRTSVLGRWKVVDLRILRAFWLWTWRADCVSDCAFLEEYWETERTYAFEGGFGSLVGFGAGLL